MSDSGTPTFDAEQSAEVLFLPLADPERRCRDPLRALTAAKELDLLLKVARESAVIERGVARAHSPSHARPLRQSGRPDVEARHGMARAANRRPVRLPSCGPTGR